MAFNIPVNEDRDYYKVVLHSKQKLDLDDGAEQFYVLDLDLLKSIAEELEKYTPDVMDIEKWQRRNCCKCQGRTEFIHIYSLL